MHLMCRLEGTQHALAVSPSLGLLMLEEKLRTELNETLHQEEVLWMQKSIINWLRLGEKNIRFFHTTTLVRRRRNHIGSLRDEHGQWRTDP